MKKWIILAMGFLAISMPFATVRAETVWYPLPQEAFKFGTRYPEAQRLLFAFDYGHALIYERLILGKGKITDPAKLESELLIQILAILKNPPVTKPSEEDIAPAYTYSLPLIINLFDWSHDLHQFIYDVLATATDRGPAMSTRINEIFLQYQGNSTVALTNQCKTMLFMDGHYFSKAFRRTYPSLNLLIWSYHWLQIKLYEALMKPALADRDHGVADVIKQFWALVSDLPDSADFDMMPSTPKEAPTFAAAFPNIWPAFDNLHMLHDVISDMMVSDRVAPEALRSEGIRFGRMAQDPAAFKAPTCESN